MTTVVAPHLIAAINALEIPCAVLEHHNSQPCGDPAAWLITWIPRLQPHDTYGPMPFCIAHWAALQTHRAHCIRCQNTWDITAEEI